MYDKIIPIEINVNHNCDNNLCSVGETLSIVGTFKNVSDTTKTSRIGAKVNNVVFSDMYITLDPDEEYTYICNLMLLNDSYYDICLFAE